MAITENVAMTQQQSHQQAQPGQKQNMMVAPLTAAQQQQGFQEEQTPDGKPEHLNLRGGCPGKLCGLPILPCHCDCWIIPLPCC